METNIKSVNSFKKWTISTVVISAFLVIALTVLLILVFTVFQKNDLPQTAKQLTRGLPDNYKFASALGAGLACIGFIGSGVGQGIAASRAVEAIGRNPEAEGKIRNMFFIGAAVAESSALYALTIAIMCLFVA